MTPCAFPTLCLAIHLQPYDGQSRDASNDMLSNSPIKKRPLKCSEGPALTALHRPRPIWRKCVSVEKPKPHHTGSWGCDITSRRGSNRIPFPPRGSHVTRPGLINRNPTKNTACDMQLQKQDANASTYLDFGHD